MATYVLILIYYLFCVNEKNDKEGKRGEMKLLESRYPELLSDSSNQAFQ